MASFNNPLRDIYSNIHVTVRVKPSSNSKSIISKVDSDPKMIKLYDESFTFNHIIWENESQERVYKVAAYPFVDKALKGYNATIFAYGQTRTGKSYTTGSLIPIITGTWRNTGLIQRCLKHIFEEKNIQVSATFIEMYNEELHDLFYIGARLTMHRDGTINPKIKRITSHVEGLELIKKALELRQECPISLNTTTSQSHAVLTFYLKIKDGTQLLESKLSLIDLAGIKVIQQAQFENVQQFNKRSSINQNLSALNRVLIAMIEEKDLVPTLCKNSILTSILKDSFDNRSLISLIACISSDPSDYNESLRTLCLAERVKHVKIQPTKMTLINPVNVTDRLKATTQKLPVALSPLSNNVSKHHYYSKIIPPIEHNVKNCTVVLNKYDAANTHEIANKQECKENVPPLNHIDNESDIQNQQIPPSNTDETVESLTSTLSISGLESRQNCETPVKTDLLGPEPKNCVLSSKDNIESLTENAVMSEPAVELETCNVRNLNNDTMFTKCPVFEFDLLDEYLGNSRKFPCKAPTSNQTTENEDTLKLNNCSSQGVRNVELQGEDQTCSTSQNVFSNYLLSQKSKKCSKRKSIMNAVLTTDFSEPSCSEKFNHTAVKCEDASFQMSYHHSSNKVIKTSGEHSPLIPCQVPNSHKIKKQYSENTQPDNMENENIDLYHKKQIHSKNILKIINSSTAEQLIALPQIGYKTAIIIYQYRLIHGQFKTLKDLENVPTWSKKLREKFFSANNIVLE